MLQDRPARWQRAAILLILLGGFALRVVAFDAAPPGMIHDEVRSWLNVNLVWQGEIRALYPYGGGREALYMFLAALSYRLIGNNPLAGRLPALALGMAGIAGSYALARRFWGYGAGLVAAAGYAVSFWALMFARFAERTGMMPALALVTANVYAAAMLARGRVPARRWLLAGGLLGLTLYTYPAALMLPPILVGWLGLAAGAGWLNPRDKGRGVAVSLVLTGLMALPLAAAWRDPAQTARADAVNAPLEALVAGDPQPVLANIGPVLGMFSVAGDHGLEFNVQDQPIFPTPLLAGFFYLGAVMAAVGLVLDHDPRRRSGYLLAITWLLGMLIPTLVTERPVNPSRTIGMLGVVYLFPAVAWAGLSLLAGRPRHTQAAIAGVVALALAFELGSTIRGYFVIWAGNPVVRFLYQSEYRDIAHELGDMEGLAIGGLTPDMLDPASLMLLAPDAFARSAGYFDPQTSLLITPAHCLVLPRSISLHPALAGRLAEWRYSPVREAESYALVCSRTRALLPDRFLEGEGQVLITPRGEPIVAFLLHEVAGSPASGQPFTAITYWRAQQPSATPLRIFVHVVDGSGGLMAQSDVLGVPATQWRPGDLIVQAHDLALPAGSSGAPYRLLIGVYDPDTGERLRLAVPPGADFVERAVE